MKKNIITCSFILSILLLSACKPPAEDNTTSNTDSSGTSVVNQVASNTVVSTELLSKDAQLKITVEDFDFKNKLDDADFMEKNPIDTVDAKNIVLYQASNDDVLLSAIKDDRMKTQTKEAVEQKLKTNTTLKNLLVEGTSEQATDRLFAYHYTYTDTKTQKTYNESCVGLKEGYLVCAVGDKDFVLLDRLVNTAEIVKAE